MHANEHVLRWLSSLPEPRLNRSHPRSAQAVENRNVHTPPDSLIEDEMSLSKKRSHADVATADNPISAPQTLTAPSSRASTTSSPRKALMDLQLLESAIFTESLDIESPPVPEATALFESFQQIRNHQKIIPAALKADITTQLRERKINIQLWDHIFGSDSQQEELPGQLPSFEEIEKLFNRAKDCWDNRCSEAVWNYKVHMQLLDSICTDEDTDFYALPCTTAYPHKSFVRKGVPTHMIDLCIATRPLAPQDGWTDRMKKFATLSLTGTVNHTDCVDIKVHPLMLSIETKRPGVDGDKAHLQMATWLASQWSFLHWAVDRKLRVEGAMDLDRTSSTKHPILNPADPEACAAALSKLAFIPAVIVQGHDWSLVVSTYNPTTREMTLFAQQPFGTTGYRKDTYAVVAGIRRLLMWARDKYKPWLLEYVID